MCFFFLIDDPILPLEKKSKAKYFTSDIKVQIWEPQLTLPTRGLQIQSSQG